MRSGSIWNPVIRKEPVTLLNHYLGSVQEPDHEPNLTELYEVLDIRPLHFRNYTKSTDPIIRFGCDRSKNPDPTLRVGSNRVSPRSVEFGSGNLQLSDRLTKSGYQIIRQSFDWLPHRSRRIKALSPESPFIFICTSVHMRSRNGQWWRPSFRGCGWEHSRSRNQKGSREVWTYHAAHMNLTKNHGKLSWNSIFFWQNVLEYIPTTISGGKRFPGFAELIPNVGGCAWQWKVFATSYSK